ncbi:MAG: hypothetical protein VX519_06080, partial [Myxococcota bacterium]|nr:hypothetical protein [Myxococcota bacterium]
MFVGLLMASPALAECPSPDVARVAGAGVEAVIDDEYAQARLDVEVALANLECLDHLVEPKSLATLWQVRAAMAYFDGESSAVAADLRQAAAVNAEFFENRLGRDIRAIWEHELKQDSGEAQAQVQLAHRGQVLWVDGVLRSDSTVALRPGVHLVQVVEDGRLQWVRLLDVRDGETATFDLRPNTGNRSNQVLLGMGIGAAGGAVLTWATAVVLDRQSYQVNHVESHDQLWFSARRFQALSVGLGGTAV